jgi:TatD DNase family protein
MIDSHCHLADEAFAADLESVVQRARQSGLERALVILEAGNEGEAARAVRVQALWPDVRTAIGVHPHIAHQYAGEPDRVEQVVRSQIAAAPSARAVGEIGLDYHYDHSPRDVQQEIFARQIRIARELTLPVVVHTREADEDTLTLLRDEGKGEVQGVLHCFTGPLGLAQAALELGLFVSLAGIVTFPRAAALRDVAREVPLDRLLVETDSPFLSPVPHRGTRNEPAHVAHVIAAVAQIHHLDPGEVARRTSANFHRLFRP